MKIDFSDIERLEHDLGRYNSVAVPIATKTMLNNMAFEGRRSAQAIIAKRMTLRNKWTLGSIRVVKVRGLKVRSMHSTLGSTAKYMETQEFGGTKTKKGSRGVNITTSYAAGQEGQQPRTKLAKPSNRAAKIRLAGKSIRKGSRRLTNHLKVKEATKTKNKHVFLDLGRRQGIFRVTGGKRNPKVKMVSDLSSKSVKIPKTPWLAPSSERAQRVGPRLWEKAIQFQAQRAGLFK